MAADNSMMQPHPVLIEIARILLEAEIERQRRQKEAAAALAKPAHISKILGRMNLAQPEEPTTDDHAV